MHTQPCCETTLTSIVLPTPGALAPYNMGCMFASNEDELLRPLNAQYKAATRQLHCRSFPCCLKQSVQSIALCDAGYTGASGATGLTGNTGGTGDA